MSDGSRKIRPRLSAWIAGILRQTPVPIRHARSLLGMGVAVAFVLLFAALIAFRGYTDIDTQPPQLADYRVEVNSQRWAELANLPRIGEKTAKRIIAHGETIGGFQTIDQLMEVKGVGPKTLDGLRSYLTNEAQDADK